MGSIPTGCTPMGTFNKSMGIGSLSMEYTLDRGVGKRNRRRIQERAAKERDEQILVSRC